MRSAARRSTTTRRSHAHGRVENRGGRRRLHAGVAQLEPALSNSKSKRSLASKGSAVAARGLGVASSRSASPSGESKREAVLRHVVGGASAGSPPCEPCAAARGSWASGSELVVSEREGVVAAVEVRLLDAICDPRWRCAQPRRARRRRRRRTRRLRRARRAAQALPAGRARRPADAALAGVARPAAAQRRRCGCAQRADSRAGLQALDGACASKGLAMWQAAPARAARSLSKASKCRSAAAPECAGPDGLDRFADFVAALTRHHDVCEDHIWRTVARARWVVTCPRDECESSCEADPTTFWIVTCRLRAAGSCPWYPDLAASGRPASAGAAESRIVPHHSD